MRKNSEGQVLLVVVLTMIVALTVGLSIAARIVTELKLSKQNEESQRAFQAAESGIQQTLVRQSDIGTLNAPIELDNNAAFSTTYVTDSGQAIVLNNGLDVDQAVGADVWLSDYSPVPSLQFLNPMGGGNPVDITLYWGATNQDECPASGSDTAPAIEVIALIGPISSPTIARNIYESAGCNRISNATAGSTVGGPFTLKGTIFRNSAQMQFGGNPMEDGLIMKVIPIYNSTVIGFQSASVPFPAQGSVVTSTGTSGDTVRKVAYYKSFPQLPLEVFPYSLLSQ
ncbi:MAG: hypothetical protein Q7T54_06295 [Candidatus Levybacteria bacterium]|nr:hypothetical protein [Candidatus Levybacteria bacterium]